MNSRKIKNEIAKNCNGNLKEYFNKVNLINKLISNNIKKTNKKIFNNIIIT